MIDRVHLAVILMHPCRDQYLSRCHSRSLDFHISAGSFSKVDSQCMSSRVNTALHNDHCSCTSSMHMSASFSLLRCPSGGKTLKHYEVAAEESPGIMSLTTDSHFSTLTPFSGLHYLFMASPLYFATCTVLIMWMKSCLYNIT